MDDRLQRAPVGAVTVTADGRVTGVNDAASDLLGVDGEQTGAPIGDVFPTSVEDSLSDAVAVDGVAAAEFEEYYPEPDRWLAVSVVPEDGGGTVYLRDVTERRRHEQTVERLRTERERTAVIDALRSDVLAALVGASSREEITETICTRLGETGRYEFAWVGERPLGGDGLAVRAVAGDTGETFDAVRESLDGPATTPEERAVDTGRLQAVQPLAADPDAPEPVRVAAFADGVQSMLAIPLVTDASVSGVVGVYAGDRDAFSERERSSFRTLGEIAGFAVTAARNRNLLLSDAVTELTVEVGDSSALSSLAAELDAALSLAGLVPRGDDGLFCYVTVDGGDLGAADEQDAAAGDERDAAVDGQDAVGDVATGVEGVGAVRLLAVSEADGAADAEVELRGRGPLLAASSLGATVRSAAFDSGSGRIVVELPPDGDTRRVADALDREFGAEVVAKRERERPATTARALREELGDRLTDRQEAALRAAYLADYFESPRGSTAEEVAGSLGITGSTLLYHLRAGQRKLLSAFFRDPAAGDEDWNWNEEGEDD